MSDYTKTWAGTAEISHITVPGAGRLRYLKAGNGPALVLMHTLRTQLDYFQRIIPHLTGRFTVYAVDLPGLGWSDITPGYRYEEPSIRHSIVDFIGQLGLEDFTLAGESMGATLSLTVAAELGKRINHVVAFNTYDYQQGLERANLLASIVGKAMRIPLLGLIPSKAENEIVLTGVLRGGFYDPSQLPKDFVAELIRSGHRPGYAHVETAYLRNLKTFIAARQLYGRVNVPVTLVYGDRDWSRPAERDAVAKLLPGSTVLTLPRTGHFSSLERPGEVARILIEAAAATKT